MCYRHGCRMWYEAYFLFRMMSARYFVRLHTIGDDTALVAGGGGGGAGACSGGDDQSLLMLCKLFENILQESEPSVFFLFMQMGVSPLTYAFPWITSAFVGHLSVDQLLLVWDRIIGNDSLLVLPVLAAAIFAFRKKALMAATCVEDIEEALEDLQELKAIPILQAFIAA